MSSQHIKELLEYKTIIFYKEEFQFPKTFITHIKPPYTILNLSVDKKLEEMLVKSFYIQKLPCMYINGQIIYEDDTDITLSIEKVKKQYLQNGTIGTYTNINAKEVECTDNEPCVVEGISTLGAFKDRKISFRALTVINNCLKNKNFVFIKGTPDRPECGFTRQLIDILRDLGMVNGRDYQYFNIFSDEDVRQTLKEVNEWPTFPMIYLKKEFIGGLDVLKEMIEDKSIRKYIGRNE